MRAFLTYATLLLLLVLLLAPAEAIWGGKKKGNKEQDKKKPSGKDSADLGLQAFQELCECFDVWAGGGSGLL